MQSKPMGTLDFLPAGTADKIREKVATRVVKDADSGCFTWSGRVDHNGYGVVRFMVDGSMRQCAAHRVAWLALVGDIPVDLILDHLCRNRACVNVSHLELVTPRENVARGAVPVKNHGPGGYEYRRPHYEVGGQCASGHILSEANLIVRVTKQGHWQRECKDCRREYMREYERTRRAALSGAIR